jgi:hypothetical protein
MTHLPAFANVWSRGNDAIFVRETPLPKTIPAKRWKRSRLPRNPRRVCATAL